MKLAATRHFASTQLNTVLRGGGDMQVFPAIVRNSVGRMGGRCETTDVMSAMFLLKR